MSEQTEQELPEEDLPEEEAPLKERAEELEMAAYATHGLLTTEGEVLDTKIEDTLFDVIVKAEVHKTSERKTTTLTRTALTRVVVPNMPGPGEYTEQDDPEAAEQAWSRVNARVWRMCDPNSTGRIQRRLNGEHALILCRTDATSEKGVMGVYVTREWACIKADFIAPDQRAIERAIVRMAANGVMGAERLPEHGRRFRRELSAETKRVLSTGVARIDRMIEAGDDEDDDSSDDGE